eukprot:1376072-Rhodomonas_salina.1
MAATVPLSDWHCLTSLSLPYSAGPPPFSSHDAAGPGPNPSDSMKCVPVTEAMPAPCNAMMALACLVTVSDLEIQLRRLYYY